MAKIILTSLVVQLAGLIVGALSVAVGMPRVGVFIYFSSIAAPLFTKEGRGIPPPDLVRILLKCALLIWTCILLFTMIS